MPRVNDVRASVATGFAAETEGPAHLVLMGLVARQYYLDNRSKVEIGKDLGLSRFKVARLIEEARTRGIVRIDIVEDVDLDIDLSVRLRAQLGLSHALVLARSADDSAERLGSVTARLLVEILTDDDVLGLPWSRTVGTMASHLRQLPAIPVVQLCGSLPPRVDEDTEHIDDRTPVELVVQAARLAGTVGHVFFAPLLVHDEASAQAFRREPLVDKALSYADKVTTAVVGIGAWLPGQSTIYDFCEPGARESVGAAGAIGEICGVFFDRDGNTVRTLLSSRIMGINSDQLRNIAQVIAIAAGIAKAEVIEAAAWSGLISGVVCDVDLATRVLEVRAARLG